MAEKNIKEPVYLGLIGFPAFHSLSPRMHKKALKLLNISGEYLAFEIPPERFEKAVEGAKNLGFRGLNITLPFKERAYKMSDEVGSDEVKFIGSANTLLFENGKIKCFNTDVFGFEKALEKKGYQIEGKKIAVIGAGGASRAVVFSSLKNKAKKITIFNRTKSKAEKIAEDMQTLSSKTEIEIKELKEIDIDEFDIVVNATSLGWKDENLLDIFQKVKINKNKKEKKLFFDTIYRKTPFLKEGEKLGYDTEDGKWMLVLQGAKSFEIWLGIYPPDEEMLKEIENM
ncbi:Shikimate dehydrogenase (NADP(+)) [bacterium HR19]|nr:Shikimate dehydrogenase (NADP(+)) [bacterium HR19]